MKARKYALAILLASIGMLAFSISLKAQTLDCSKSVFNLTTNTAATTAAIGNQLEYTIVIKNLGGVVLTNAILLDNIPAGCSYIAGSTTLNNYAVADVGGAMPFSGSGSSINTPLQAVGALAAGATATIKFKVRVTANGGAITNYAIVECRNNSSNIVQGTNSVVTNLSADALCSTVYTSVATSAGGIPGNGYYYKNIKVLNTNNGQSSTGTLYTGGSGICKNAITGATLSPGSILYYASAIGYDRNTNRIYFVNNESNPAQDLCYIDLNSSPVTAYRFVGQQLETNTASGYAINRMGFASDGYGYAITTNGKSFIRFSVGAGNALTIDRPGPLINDPNNGSDNDILDEAGGDIFGDGSGNLYLVANSAKLYKINPNTRITTYLGTVNPFPADASNSIAVDAAGNVYIGGAYRTVYKVNLATMAGTSLNGSNSTNVYTTGDYTSCAFPVLAPLLTANKTYSNINGNMFIVGGDTVEYRIEVINSGNINAAGVKLHDALPAGTLYIANSTRVNGSYVADVNGEMPFSVTGGKLINSAGESAGIIRPGESYKAVLTFRAKVPALTYVCNQSKITLLDANGNTIYIYSNDPSVPAGGQNPTCFFSDGTLPLRNLEFTGSLLNDRSQLEWLVQQEQNISYYEVQYSEDGSHFSAIGQVSSKGNTNGTHEYSFTDNNHVTVANRYYRLKAVGARDGDETLSPIVKLSLRSLQTVKVQPNPFEKELKVKLNLRNPEQVRIRLLDISGQQLYKTDERLSRGDHTIDIPVSARMSPGVYLLEIFTGSDNYVVRQKLIRR
ncbi:MAG: T9SS type A sorting domain-containing protein [Candidatus Pseudobacter hemicellulosilyticus]|uniref:T9SS type A sorting domain-containing protein n=1 Tax=Candidatus Pseudobacter hemicellulosilyticus TaxID=3121375 RepID=A0AAJ5WZQ6_9BACT|nr:MAG: T9SS type A sorting domain-containing protein [Pseudobacter sp.]